MPKCRYCSSAFDDEDAYSQHLQSDHIDELGPIDRRRISGTGDASGLPTGPIALGAIVVVGIIVVGYVVFGSGGTGGTADGPHSIGSVHEHGTMEVVIDGAELDLSAAPFLERDNAFHFHAGYYETYGAHIWHAHAQGITLQYALGTLGIDVNDDGTELHFDGRTYRSDAPDTEIVIEVNGEPVTPGSYVLEGVGPEDRAAAGDGDDIRVLVHTTS